MIAAIHPLSRSFKVPIRYVEVGRDGRQNRVAWAETYNLPTGDLELAACFMGATANGSVSRTRTPVYFFSVSFDIDDPVDEAMMGRVARRTLRDMGWRSTRPSSSRTPTARTRNDTTFEISRLDVMHAAERIRDSVQAMQVLLVDPDRNAPRPISDFPLPEPERRRGCPYCPFYALCHEGRDEPAGPPADEVAAMRAEIARLRQE